MTAAALLADLHKRDVILAAAGDALDVDAPRGVLTADLRAALVAHKAELLALLRETTAAADGKSHRGAPPALTAEAVADWASRSEVVTIRSRTLGKDVYLVPDTGAGLLAAGVPRHCIYLPAELVGLVGLLRLPAGPRAQTVQALDALREAFGPDLDVLEVRPVSPPRCPACHGGRWWRSVAGRTVCATCHPPATPGLVAEWLGAPSP